MDEIAKILIGSSPILAVVLLLGTQLIATVKDLVIMQTQAKDERADIKARLKRLEEHVIGDVSPTLTRDEVVNGSSG